MSHKPYKFRNCENLSVSLGRTSNCCKLSAAFLRDGYYLLHFSLTFLFSPQFPFHSLCFILLVPIALFVFPFLFLLEGCSFYFSWFEGHTTPTKQRVYIFSSTATLVFTKRLRDINSPCPFLHHPIVEGSFLLWIKKKNLFKTYKDYFC